MIIDTLRAETKRDHSNLDQSLYPFISGVNSLDKYSKLLSVFYGYFKPMYQQLDHFLNDNLIYDYSKRRKPSSILTDAENAGIDLNEDILCNYTPSINNYNQALGAYYVLEGSTMGGIIISKKLKDQLHINETALSFFRGYGENNTIMWKNFLDVLNNVEDISPDGKELINKAKETFATFKKWINEQYGKS